MAKNEMPMHIIELKPQPTLAKALAANKAHVEQVHAVAGSAAGPGGATTVGGHGKGKGQGE